MSERNRGDQRRAGTASLGILIAWMALGSLAPSQDFGYEGPTYTGASGSPSGSKPESKLWFYDGDWWGSLWSDAFSQFRIHRLESSTQTWEDTGTVLDSRKNSRSDILFDGSKLYIASHSFGSTQVGKPTRLYRLSFNGILNRFQHDFGFPVQINNYKLEAVVIDKDSVGTIWATWAQNNQVYVNHSLGSDDLWGAPFVLPTTTSVTTDDLSSVIHFNGDRVGVCWSDQVASAFLFSYHLDGDPDTAWSPPETISMNGYNSDDHLNLKTDSLGQVYAAVKDSDGSVFLLVRRPDSTWSQFLAGEDGNNFTRPIIEINEEAAEIYYLASTGSSGGTIYLKTSPLGNLFFPDGLGTPLIRDADALHMNDASSTKQNVDSTTGLVVLATNQLTKRYWHAAIPLLPPGPPMADFSASPTQGEAPIVVQFTDISPGRPTSWFWDFGDGNSSTGQHPSHIYSIPGTYSVELSVGNDYGDDSELKADFIVVDSPPPSVPFVAVEDSHVKSTSPDNNYGTQTTLRVRKSSTEEYRPYMKFDVSGVPGTITSAKLLLYVTDGSPDGGNVYLVDSQWAETSITWNNAPLISGDPLGSLGGVTSGTFVEVDLSSTVTSEGTYSFAMTNMDSNSAYYMSREDIAPPELVVFYQ